MRQEYIKIGASCACRCGLRQGVDLRVERIRVASDRMQFAPTHIQRELRLSRCVRADAICVGTG